MKTFYQLLEVTKRDAGMPMGVNRRRQSVRDVIANLKFSSDAYNSVQYKSSNV